MELLARYGSRTRNRGNLRPALHMKMDRRRSSVADYARARTHMLQLPSLAMLTDPFWKLASPPFRNARTFISTLTRLDSGSILIVISTHLSVAWVYCRPHPPIPLTHDANHMNFISSRLSRHLNLTSLLR